MSSTDTIDTDQVEETTLDSVYARELDAEQLEDSLSRFFTKEDGEPTYATKRDLLRIIPDEEAPHLEPIEFYWTNKPFAFIGIYENTREKEKRYFVVEPTLTEMEANLVEFLRDKLEHSMPYEDPDEMPVESTELRRKKVVRRESAKLLRRYGLIQQDTEDEGIKGWLTDLFQELSLKLETHIGTARVESEGVDPESMESFLDDNLVIAEQDVDEADISDDIGGDDPPKMDKSGTAEARKQAITGVPRPVDSDGTVTTLTKAQTAKILYYIERNLIGFRQIDAIRHDSNVEDIHCIGYNTRVQVTHTEHEKIVTNVVHGKEELDDFVIRLAQQAGKGLSKRQPDVDVKLPDGSRGNLTLGREIAEKGSNYTIRQFNDIPYTPIDLISWQTMNIEQMVYLWLAVENGKSTIFAGGTSAGKTTTLNALSLFIPSNQIIVSIEDTREIEIPQAGHIASTTRESFSEGGLADIGEYQLLEKTMRQNPGYIVMGEVRGEEGRTLFQAMNSGHTTFTTFHGDSVGEVIKRFTTEPINVAKSLFGSLDLIIAQKLVRVDGDKKRRVDTITEVESYDPTQDAFVVDKSFEWVRESDSFRRHGRSDLIAEIQHERGWSEDELQEEILARKALLAYLLKEGINDYALVASTIQAYMVDPDTVLALVAEDKLEEYITQFQNLKSIDIDTEIEADTDIPRPDPHENEQLVIEAERILDKAQVPVFAQYDEEDIDRLSKGQTAEPKLTGGMEEPFGELFEEDDEGDETGATVEKVDRDSTGDSEMPRATVESGPADSEEDSVSTEDEIDTSTGVDQDTAVVADVSTGEDSPTDGEHVDDRDEDVVSESETLVEPEPSEDGSRESETHSEESETRILDGEDQTADEGDGSEVGGDTRILQSDASDQEAAADEADVTENETRIASPRESDGEATEDPSDTAESETRIVQAGEDTGESAEPPSDPAEDDGLTDQTAGDGSEGTEKAETTPDQSNRSDGEQSPQTDQSDTSEDSPVVTPEIPNGTPPAIRSYLEQMAKAGGGSGISLAALVEFSAAGNITKDGTLEKVSGEHIDQFADYLRDEGPANAALEDVEVERILDEIESFYNWFLDDDARNPVTEASKLSHGDD